MKCKCTIIWVGPATGKVVRLEVSILRSWVHTAPAPFKLTAAHTYDKPFFFETSPSFVQVVPAKETPTLRSRESELPPHAAIDSTSRAPAITFFKATAAD